MNRFGYVSAWITILIWGTTFTSTKLLLRDFSPDEILLIRSLIAYLALYLVKPKRLELKQKSHNWLFAAAGLCGITLYYLFENNALTFTSVANTSLIVTTSPFFIAVISSVFLKGEKPGILFYLGFLSAIAGIALISFNGRIVLQLNPFGDLLALGASFAWAFYSIFTRIIGLHRYDTVQSTRRVFGFGIVFMLPVTLYTGFHSHTDFLNKASLLLKQENAFLFLYLGACASAICFGTWNYAIRTLGAVRSSVYIYMIPVISMTTSALILREPVTPALAVGTALTLFGLFLSEYKSFRQTNG